MKAFTLIGLLAMFIIAGCADTTQQPESDDPWRVDESEETTSLGCIPEPEPVWTSTNDEPRYVPGRIQFSQNDGLFAMTSDWYGPNQVARTHDGEIFALVGRNHPPVLDKSWDLITRTDSEDFTQFVEQRSTGERLVTLQPHREDAEIATVELSASGRIAAAMTCESGQYRLLRWSLASGDLTHSENIGSLRDRCRTWNGLQPHLFFGPAGHTLLVVFRQSGELFHVDLESGERREGRVELVEPGESTAQRFATTIIDAHIGPGGRRVLLSTADGDVEVRRLPSFERLARFESGVHLLNEMTYAPRIHASPVAWAPGGDRFASLSPEGDVIIRDLDGAILQRFPAAVAEARDMWGMPDSAVALGFSHDGTRLAVGHYFGAALYACDGASFPRSAERFDADVSLTGPIRIGTEAPHEWRAEVDGHPGAVARFLLDGEPVSSSDDGVFRRRFRESGTYELTVEYDDGRTTGRASMTLVVE
jgi:hypothetical protein